MVPSCAIVGNKNFYKVTCTKVSNFTFIKSWYFISWENGFLLSFPIKGEHIRFFPFKFALSVSKEIQRVRTGIHCQLGVVIFFLLMGGGGISTLTFDSIIIPWKIVPCSNHSYWYEDNFQKNIQMYLNTFLKWRKPCYWQIMHCFCIPHSTMDKNKHTCINCIKW